MADQRHRPAARRIVILLSSMGRGGAERVAATLSSAWAEQGREVWLMPTYLGGREVAYPLDDAVRLRFLADVPGSMEGRTPAPWRKLRALRCWLRELDPDVVVSFLPNINVLAIAATRGLGIPLVVCERADPAAGVEMGWALHLARTLSYPFASRVCVQTFQAALRLRRRLPGCGELAVVPNPLPAALERSRNFAAQAGEGGTVVAVGRLSAEKGFDLLLRAFRDAFSDVPGWRLEIWGDGPLRARLDAEIRTLGLVGRASLCGPTSDPWGVMSQAQIFALTSAYEGFPNAMLEAMALGVAAVAFDCNSGPRDLTDGGRVGVLVPAGDVGALAAELRALATDPPRRAALGQAGATFVRTAFSEQAVLQRWDEVFEGVVTQRTSAWAQRVP